MKEEAFYPTRESFPTTCDCCDADIDTEMFRGKGFESKNKPHGHKDPRHKFGVYCSIDCSKKDGGSGTVYPSL